LPLASAWAGKVNMYDFIRGKLVKKLATEAIVDVNGIGFQLRTSVSTSEMLAGEGEEVTLKTYLQVREDILQLYGFADEQERDIFLGLISISGVGPKLAQTILSGLSAANLVNAIQNGDETTLNKISGVGKKTAQRLIVELKDKLESVQVEGTTDQSQEHFSPNALEREALMALMSLGYNRPKAEIAIKKVRKSDTILTSEELIKKALQAV